MQTTTNFIALLLVASLATAAASAAARPSTQRTLVLDAVASSHKVGDVQAAAGVLRDADGRSLGRFAYRCRRVDNGRERCSGWGRTGDGRLDFAGTTESAAQTNVFPIRGGTGAYAGAGGTVAARDLDATESVLTAEVDARPDATLHAAVVARPPAAAAFRARADSLCSAAATRLESLPHFPFDDFDPLHPDGKRLPEVGRFFTGSGDPRPTLTTLQSRLRALGEPPAAATEWDRVRTALAHELGVRDEQDRAALAGDGTAFVKSVHGVHRAYRAVAIATAVFGVPRCTI
jgi:hypothetical protein